jgi:hypothetical protein
MTKFFLIVLSFIIALSPTFALADGKIFSIKKGQRAPFEGTLFNTEAAADLTVRLENNEAQCRLKIKKAEDLCKAKSEFDLSLKIAELESLEYKHTQLMSIKNDQIDFLRKKALRVTPWYENNKFWFGVGIVAGLGLSFGSAYAWGQVSR